MDENKSLGKRAGRGEPFSLSRSKERGMSLKRASLADDLERGDGDRDDDESSTAILHLKKKARIEQGVHPCPGPPPASFPWEDDDRLLAPDWNCMF
jgi:hypothetical protein